MNQNASQNSIPLIGAWKLISFVLRKDSGETIPLFGEDPKGLIVYTESGCFSAQVMRSDRPLSASEDQMEGTLQEMEANYKGCVSYFGAYEFNPEAGFVVHHVEGSLFPNWEGKDQKRFFELSGNRLKLSTPPMSWGGEGEVVGVLLWERMG